MQSDKLKNFPKVYYISLEESVDRRENLEKQFAEYGITPTAIISKKWAESNDIVDGPIVQMLNSGTKGSLISHLKMLKKWYVETDDEWAFFCEDDLSLETVKYWNFTWEQLMEKVPKDALGVQMLIINDKFETFDFQKRKWDDWGATAYILKRDYVKKLIEKYCVSDNKFYIEIYSPKVNSQIWPLVENAIFDCVFQDGEDFFYASDFFYTIPLFVEDVWKFDSTFSDSFTHSGEPEPLEKNEYSAQKGQHYESSTTVLNYWKNKGLNND